MNACVVPNLKIKLNELNATCNILMIHFNLRIVIILQIFQELLGDAKFLKTVHKCDKITR